MTTPLFKNPEVFEETIDVKEVMPRQKHDKERLTFRINSLIKQRKSAIIAFIGPFGSGKSVLLRQVLKGDSWTTHTFEVWRCKDRDQIWDSFVAEVCARTNKKSSESLTREDIIKEAEDIDGETWVSRFLTRRFKQLIIGVPLIWLIVSTVLWWWLVSRIDPFSLFLKAGLKYAVGTLFVILAFVGVGNLAFKNRPLKRTVELENKLDFALRKLEKPFVIVIEDVDWAVPDGIIFMETLQDFLRRNKGFEQSIIVIAPQTLANFDVTLDKENGFERGVKIYNEVMYYVGSTLEMDDVVVLIDRAQMNEQFRDEFVDVLRSLADGFVKRRRDPHTYFSLRVIKFIIRAVDQFIAAYPDANPTAVLILLLARYVRPYNVKEETVSSKLFSGERLYRGNNADENIWGFVDALYRIAEKDSSTNEFNNVDIFFDSEDLEVSATTESKRCILHLHSRYRVLVEG